MPAITYREGHDVIVTVYMQSSIVLTENAMFSSSL